MLIPPMRLPTPTRRSQFGIQSAVLGELPDTGLIRLFTHMSMTHDPRAAKNMVPDKVWHAIPADPEIEKLERQRQMLKEGRYRINSKDTETEVRDLTEDVEEEGLNPTVSLRVAERSCLAQILWNQPADLGSDDLFYRRIQATELMTALCLKWETKKRDQRRVRMQAHTRIEEESPRPDPSPLLMYKTQCPFALGQGLVPPGENGSIQPAGCHVRPL
ncbi:hypothetical protein ANO14919_113490 [Xylariales sp. No.14919]|nr:hypothetical protein ANO14919_113490 [Xylariales sp. No.14919]